MTDQSQAAVLLASQDADGGARSDRRSGWLRFFGLLLPFSFLGFLLIAQGAASALRGVQPLRSSLDTIALRALHLPGHADWLIFGDSLSQHVLMDVSVGDPARVADLTTHAGAGMPSMYLLLRRYLSTHPAPHHVLLAVSPETYADVPSQKDGGFWLVPTFLEPDEQAWLSRFYPA